MAETISLSPICRLDAYRPRTICDQAMSALIRALSVETLTPDFASCWVNWSAVNRIRPAIEA